DVVVELGLSFAAPRRGREPYAARPFGIAECQTKPRPLVVAPYRERHPAVVASGWIHAVRHGHAVVVGIARRHGAVRRVLEERGREELQTRLVLREVDDASLAGAAVALERGEDRDDAVA